MVLNLPSEPLSIEHQSLLISLWRPLCVAQNLKFAEYNFTNTFLTRKKHEYRVILSDPPLVLGRFESGDYYIIPTCLPEELDLELFSSVESKICFFPIPDQWLSFFQQRNFECFFDRADSDYLFKREKLEMMKGRDLSSRRNLLHQFESHYKLEIKDLKHENLVEAERVLELWQSETQKDKEMTDYAACKSALEFFAKLELFGRLLYADGIPVGFTLGKLLTQSTALLHYSKSLHEFKGATPFLYRDFADHLPQSVEWINLMQDLGIPSLRQAKEAYLPDAILSKWRVSNPK